MTVFFLQSSEAQVYAGINQRLEEGAKEHSFVLSSSHGEHLLHMYSSKYAYIADMTGIWVELSKSCDVEVMKEKFLMAPYSIGLQDNSAYREVISNM